MPEEPQLRHIADCYVEVLRCAEPAHLGMTSFVCLKQFHVHEVHHHIGPAVQQHNVATDQDVRTIGRRRRQVANQLGRARMNLLFQPGRQRSAAHQLLFESWWQTVFLREARGKIVAVSVVPVVNFLVMPVIVIAVITPVVVPMFILVMAFSMSMALTVALRKRVLAKKQAARERSANHPFCQLHSSLLENREFFSIYLCRMGKVFRPVTDRQRAGLALRAGHSRMALLYPSPLPVYGRISTGVPTLTSG